MEKKKEKKNDKPKIENKYSKQMHKNKNPKEKTKNLGEAIQLKRSVNI